MSQSEVLGWFYNPNTTPKDKERVVVCLHGTGQELHLKGYYTKGIDAAKEQRLLWLAEVKKDDWNKAWTPLEPRAKTCT